MAKKNRDKLIIAQHVLEVRHAASGSFLDVRGYVADYIRSQGLFPHWNIDTNVVNFKDLPEKVEKEGAFAGYKSAGYLVYNPETRNYFIDKASSFWRILLKNQHYKIPDTIRFGTRTKAFLPTNLPFDQLNELVFREFFTKKAKALVGGQETDVQFVIEIAESKFAVRVAGGPTHEGEARKYLDFESEHFDKCGVFLDIDFSKTEKIPHDTIPRLLREAVELTWAKVENIAAGLGI